MVNVQLIPRTFNRTIVELKQEYDFDVVLGDLSFNRTIVELKLKGAAATVAVLYPFNRTIVELKQNQRKRFFR